jgi:hypothetical protein
MELEKPIRSIVDRSLGSALEAGVNNWPSDVHPLMSDAQPSPYADEGYTNWLPIASTVTDEQLASVEALIGYQLPTDYKAFLQYKHFYELLIGQAEFFAHAAGDWMDSLLSEYQLNQPASPLHKNLIPFASWGGTGDLLCFDVSRNNESCDYPVVVWDHESADYFEDFSLNFSHLLVQLDAESK